MKAESLLKERRVLTETAFLDMVIWKLPGPVAGSQHHFKYRLALVVEDMCVLRYDNEAGKGDYKHVGTVEGAYIFTTLPQLVNDFLDDVRRWRQNHEHRND